MGGPVEVAGDQLRTIVERIERVEEEIKELNEAKKEIYLEAKSNGFDVKVLREVVRLRKQDQQQREEHESLLDTYLNAIKGPVSRLQGGLVHERDGGRNVRHRDIAPLVLSPGSMPAVQPVAACGQALG